ncbi:hypothetical protein I6A84_38770 [Frankia sp. CNm7]|uniref:Uncharacterized protein n=1 Tax=Frankia nepalensis TaxID=1836974 RepID=A0A937RIV7_9ACTN|nr:hypothetical protein [Frankia nepalensis]MBL7494972.1 hypothetical protein [Frankia nepalensis]MBL7514595.1 hypothetical protein [Frankia nepalensis]MBL7523831.1 hypothetical protein [Frankia nepalensis]MBL7633078.1 hypothetical protein [Frankia nepalensis]
MRDLRVAPDVAGLLPADLLAAWQRGPHPSVYSCAACQDDGDLEDGDPAALVVRRYPHLGLRRVQLIHAACGPSRVVVIAVPELADLELAAASGASIVYADLLGAGTAALTGDLPAGCALTGQPPRPYLAVDDDDDLILTDRHAVGQPDRPLPGEPLSPMLSHALATGLALHTSLAATPPTVTGWSLRIGARHLDLVHPRPGARRPFGIERLPHTISPQWRAAVRAAGDTAVLLMGRIGLSTATRPLFRPYLPASARRQRLAAPISGATFAVLHAVHAGQVAAGLVPVTWTGPGR